MVREDQQQQVKGTTAAMALMQLTRNTLEVEVVVPAL
jgi:hypothetical protein